MDHRLGDIDLVSWQGRRNRRLKSNPGPWTVFLVGCALFGAPVALAQAAGWVHWTGPLAAAPAVLVLVAVSAQLVALARAALAWLAG